jgi:hypothetical protein
MPITSVHPYPVGLLIIKKRRDLAEPGSERSSVAACAGLVQLAGERKTERESLREIEKETSSSYEERERERAVPEPDPLDKDRDRAWSFSKRSRSSFKLDLDLDLCPKDRALLKTITSRSKHRSFASLALSVAA